jgi:hypothetical protein
MRKFIYSFFLLFFAFFSLLSAQIVDTPFGKAEVLGLKNWSLQKVLDLLAAKAPGKSIDKCAVDLKEIGFPDASVKRYMDKDGKFYSVVTVVEPEYAEFVKYRNIPSNTLEDVPDWIEGIEMFKNNPMEFQIGLATYNSNQISKDMADFLKDLNEQKIRDFRQFISAKNQEQDKDLAIWILNNDGNYLNRVIASAILINFPGSDLVWWTLTDALRDQEARVSSTAGSVLEYFSANSPRNVRWEPAINTLFHLINGTNLFAFNTVLTVLSSTKISEKLIPELFFQTNGYLVLSYLKANHEIERNLAHKFLVNTTGKDFGYDIAKWEYYLVNLAK